MINIPSYTIDEEIIDSVIENEFYFPVEIDNEDIMVLIRLLERAMRYNSLSSYRLSDLCLPYDRFQQLRQKMEDAFWFGKTENKITDNIVVYGIRIHRTTKDFCIGFDLFQKDSIESPSQVIVQRKNNVK